MILHEITIVYAAGGTSTRMGGDTPKQFIKIAGYPLWYYAARTLCRIFDNAHWIFVFPVDYISEARKACTEFFPQIAAHKISFSEAGITRYFSVKRALQFTGVNGFTLVHDAARCFLNERLLLHLYEEVVRYQTAIPFTPCRNSLRQKCSEKWTPLNRENVIQIQTPQFFQTALLRKSYALDRQSESFTDDASVVECAGYDLHFVLGDEGNIKITYPDDIRLAQSLLSSSSL